MSANINDVFTKVGSPGGATFLTAPGHSIGGTTFTVDSTSLWPTDTAVIFGVDTTSLVNGVATRDVGSYTVWRGLVTSATQVTSCVLMYGTDQDYSAGSTTRVYVLPTSSRENRLVDGLLVSHDNTGAMIASLPLTTPKITTSINDSAGNEVIKTPATASAVNEITVTNAAAGNAPSISATGGDSAVHLNLQGKGLAKTVTIGAGATPIFPYDYVVSGCVWTADAAGSTRLASMTAGVVVINGNPITVAAVTSRTFTASKDVYVDVLDNGDGTGLLVYTDGTTNAASGALAANSIRLAIIVVGAGSIATAASVNQGQEDRVLPIASSIPYAVTDSLGNLICPRDPSRRTLGYKQILSAYSGTTNSGNGDDVTGLSVPFIADGLTKIRATIGGKSVRSSSGASGIVSVRVVEGTTELASVTQQITTNGYNMNPNVQSSLITPSAGLHTYKANLNQGGAGTQTLDCAATNPAFIRIERA